MPARMMRAATYEAAGSAGNAEVAVYYFGPGQGGDVETNMTRWINQFQGLPDGAAKRSSEEHNGLMHSILQVESGTFSSGMPGGPTTPQKDYGMSASIVTAPSGEYFFKMTGPAATVKAQQKNFSRLLESVRVK